MSLLLTRAWETQRQLCHPDTHSSLGDHSSKLNLLSSQPAQLTAQLVGEFPLLATVSVSEMWVESFDFQKDPETGKFISCILPAKSMNRSAGGEVAGPSP